MSLPARASTVNFLANYELVLFVIRECSRSDACQLARVSSALNSVAEECIWRSVCGMTHILPEALRNPEPSGQPDAEQALTEQAAKALLQSPSWVIFLRRCRAVRKASISIFTGQTELYLHIDGFTDFIFPALQHLHISLRASHFSHLTRFLPHTLRYICIDLVAPYPSTVGTEATYPSTVGAKAMHLSASTLNKLSSLTIRFFYGAHMMDNAEAPWLETFLQRLPSPAGLTHLSLQGCSLPPGVGAFIGSLPSLQVLKLGSHTGLSTYSAGSPLRVVAVDEMLRQLQAPTLDSLSLLLPVSGVPFDLSSLATFTTLTELHIGMKGTQWPRSVISLTCLVYLKTVDLTLPKLDLTLTSLEFHQLIQAWPQLHRLVLHSTERRDDDPPPLLHPLDLSCLGKHCPHLWSLGVSMHVGVDAHLPQSSCTAVPLPRKISLDLQATQVDPDADLQMYDLIKTLCPQLGWFTISENTNPHRQWVRSLQRLYRGSNSEDGDSDEGEDNWGGDA